MGYGAVKIRAIILYTDLNAVGLFYRFYSNAYGIGAGDGIVQQVAYDKGQYLLIGMQFKCVVDIVNNKTFFGNGQRAKALHKPVNQFVE
jgi:hypothetical protein